MGRSNATACYRELGEHLRKRRMAAGLSARHLAGKLGWSPSKVSRIESGQVEISDVDMIHYLGPCRVFQGAAKELTELCHTAERNLGYWLSPHSPWLPESLTSLIYHEATADTCVAYEPHMVPGLLQTADYARAMVGGRGADPERVERSVRIRMDRQRILKAPAPAPFTFFMGEQALRRRVASNAVMHEQLLKLALFAGLRQVTVRVVPASIEEPWTFGGSFRLFTFDQHRPLVYLDNYITGVFLEEPSYVQPYRPLLPVMSELALDGTQSRELIATLASEYDRGSERDAGGQMEEEQS
jgi:transcriptional regulator with XRE-family HTH domain